MNWLFRFFLLIGALIVVALFSALFAPYFVNWERFTSEFETQASRLVGQPVKVGGGSSLRLLPLPYISFENLEVGRNEDESPLMTIERFSLNAELFPFLSGEVKIVEMTMDNPEVNLKVEENGTIAWTSPQALPVDPEQINIEKLLIKNGSMTIGGLAGDRVLEIDSIQGNLSAKSVLGPWRIDANANIEDTSAELKISTGTFQDAERSIRLKVETTRADQPYKLLLDGPVRLNDGILNWEGEFSLTPFSSQRTAEMTRPVDPLPVHTEGLFLTTPQTVTVPEYRMEIGSREDPYTITGSGNVSVQEESFFRFKADGRQIDLSRFEEATPQNDAPSFESRLAVVRSILERIPVPTANGEIDAILPAVVAGDTFIREVKAVVRPLGKGWDLRAFSAVFPGNTVLEANGRLGLHENFGFAGKILVASRQPSGLAAWMSGGVDAQIRRLKTLGLASDTTITNRQATFNNLELRMDDAVLKGRLQRLASVDGRAALIAELNGNRVNIQDLRGLYSLTRDPSETELVTHDLDIKIKADFLEAQFLEKPVLAGAVDGHIRVKDGNISIERLNMGDFYGSSVKSIGRLESILERPDGNLQLDISAPKAGNLLAFVSEFTGPHILLDALRNDPALTGNSSLKLELDARSVDARTKGQLLIDGSIGGTAINTRLAFDGKFSEPERARINLTSAFSNASASLLARQFAIDTVPEEIVGNAPGPVKLTTAFKGTIADGFDGTAALSSPSTNISGKGALKLIDAQKLDYKLDVTMGSENLAPYLALAGTPLPRLGLETSLPVSLSFKVDKQEPAAKFSNIEGQLAGNSVSGNLDYQYAEIQRPKLSGTLALSRLPVPFIAESVFGYSDLFGLGDVLDEAERGFQAPLLTGYDARISVSSEQIETGFGFNGEKATTDLVMLDGAIDLSNLAFEALGGKFAGNASLKNVERNVFGTLRYSLQDVDLAEVLTVSGMKQIAGGKISINGSAEANGLSQSAMFANLSGNGVVAVKNVVLEGINPLAFESILSEADAEEFEINTERVNQVVDETVLDSALDVEFIDAPFSITRGRARVRNLAHDTTEADFVSGVEIDIANQTMEAETSIAFKPGRRDAISGADPVVRVAWRGPFNALEREIDGGQLESYLSLRAFENSQRRVETLEAQVIEKQRIQREIAFNFAREQYKVRKEEEARLALEAELERLNEEERKRAEEAIRKLQDERARLEEEIRLREEAERQRLEAERQREAEEQARLAEEERRKEEERWLLEEEQRQLEELQKAEEVARLEAERQAAAQRAAEAAAALANQSDGGDDQSGEIRGTPLPPPEPSIEVAPSLRDSIINNIENFLNTN